MSLTPQDVRNVGALARLALTDSDVELLTPQLNDLLEQFERLQRLDTTGVPATSHAVPVIAYLREDEITPSLPKRVVLAMGPEVDEILGGFVVPQVLAGDA